MPANAAIFIFLPALMKQTRQIKSSINYIFCMFVYYMSDLKINTPEFLRKRIIDLKENLLLIKNSRPFATLLNYKQNEKLR
jgi:predicted nucleotide-binding protein (sugar kinase/HSP70/actin superfamily)